MLVWSDWWAELFKLVTSCAIRLIDYSSLLVSERWSQSCDTICGAVQNSLTAIDAATVVQGLLCKRVLGVVGVQRIGLENERYIYTNNRWMNVYSKKIYTIICFVFFSLNLYKMKYEHCLSWFRIQMNIILVSFFFSTKLYGIS